MGLYTKKPVTIEAICFTESSVEQCLDFVGYSGQYDSGTKQLLIFTAEGCMRANTGDWIIKGVKGEFYPCKPDIFEATYGPATGEGNATI